MKNCIISNIHRLNIHLYDGYVTFGVVIYINIIVLIENIKYWRNELWETLWWGMPR